MLADLSAAHAWKAPVATWVSLWPASTPLVSTATGTLEPAVVPVTEFAVVVVAPAEGRAGPVQRARRTEAGRDLGHPLAGQHAAGIDGHRHAGAAGVAPESALAPAVGGTRGVNGARIPPSRRDLGKTLAGQQGPKGRRAGK